ncbi:MAG: O-antigen ligase family protein, partial [Verrucomicrobiota bacterium]
VISDIVYAAGPSLYFLFVLFPATAASLQAATQDTLMRLNGLAFAALAGFDYMLMRFGIRGVLELTKPWRLLSFLALIAVSLLGGYRSLVLILFFILVFQFAFEGLLRSRLFPVVLLFSLIAITFVIAFIQDMPLSVQRSLSFLPLEVDPMAWQDAAGTAEWRFQMWKAVLPDVPKYLLLGKGFAFSGTDYMLTQEAMRQGLFTSFEDTLISGNYHNGILTLIIPFGLLGLLSFLWFCAAAIRVLYRNYRHGTESLKLINTFLLAYFCARLVFYLTLYGQFDLDLVLFTGTVGLSVALNGGVRTRKTQESEETVAVEEAAEVEEAVPA